MKSKNTNVKLASSFIHYIEELNENVQELISIENEECSTIVPSTVDWCQSCNGTGGRSQFDVAGYDIDEMMNDNEELMRDYFSGKTDVICDSCEGTKISNIPDNDSFSKEQIEIFELNDKCYREESADRMYEEAERRAGC